MSPSSASACVLAEMSRTHLLLLASVLMAATAVDATVNPADYSVQLVYKEVAGTTGKSANLTCSLNITTFWSVADSVRWWKTQPFDNQSLEISRGMKQMIPEKNKHRYIFVFHPQTSSTTIKESLIIHNITAEDQGFYQCGAYIENYSGSSIASNKTFIQADTKVTVNMSSTTSIKDGVAVYNRFSPGQVTSCAAYVFGNPLNVTIQIYEGKENVTKEFNVTVQSKILGNETAFRASAIVFTATSDSYKPSLEEEEVLLCEARHNNTVVASSSMEVKLNDTEVILFITQQPAAPRVGEEFQLDCDTKNYDTSNKVEFTWSYVHTESTGNFRTVHLTTGENDTIAATFLREDTPYLKFKKYSGMLSNFTVIMKDNGSTVARRNFDVTFQEEKVVGRSTAVARTAYLGVLTFTIVAGFFINTFI